MQINVAKFGGTSVESYLAISNCAAIVQDNPSTRIVVVSATGGVTNLLTSMLEPGVSIEDKELLLQQVRSKEWNILEELDHPQAVSEELESLFKQLSSAVLDNELGDSPELKDQILAYGEHMSSLLVTQVFVESGVHARNFDIREVLTTDDCFGQANPLLKPTRENALSSLLPLITDNVIVTQGFIGREPNGRTTTLGRGGSDYSAALIAEAINASTCEIWTDVPGVFTADPRISEYAEVLEELSYEEAAEMATFGAKVLHPAATAPTLRSSIPLFVGSSKAPELGGTWLVKRCQQEPAFRSIARRKTQELVTLKISPITTSPIFMGNALQILGECGVSIDLMTTSETAVSLTFNEPQSHQQMEGKKQALARLNKQFEMTMESGLDLITVVGNNLQQSPGVTSRIFAAMEPYRIRLICYGANPHNVSFLISSDEGDEVMSLLHHVLFESK